MDIEVTDRVILDIAPGRRLSLFPQIYRDVDPDLAEAMLDHPACSEVDANESQDEGTDDASAEG